MSIDKESDGVPEIHPSRPGTKINLSMIAAVVLFVAIGIGLIIWFVHHHPTSSKVMSERTFRPTAGAVIGRIDEPAASPVA
jgi:hypothetical protein